MRPTGGFWDSVCFLWLLRPWCWQNLSVGNYWLFVFSQLYLLAFSSIWIALFLCNDDIKSEHACYVHARI